MLTRKEELDQVRVGGKVVVVIDVLFATTTMVAALAHGAAEVVPVLDEAAARAEGERRGGNCVLAGELYAETLPGFVHPAPLALVAHGIAGRTVVYSTTNGTVAMALAAGARRVYCGALLNATCLAEHIVAAHRGDTVLLVCAGSGGNLNFEDFYGAGCFVERFLDRLGPAADLSDAAQAARTVFRHSRLPEAFLGCRLGRMMQARGLAHEVEFACRIDAFPVVPLLEDGVLRLVT